MKVYTLEEAAETLKVSKRALYEYIKKGTLKAVKIGKAWRISEENLKDFIEKGTK